MLGDAVLAIDQGTSATKAVVTGLDGSVLALAECPIDGVARPDGSVEFDPIEMRPRLVPEVGIAGDHDFALRLVGEQAKRAGANGRAGERGQVAGGDGGDFFRGSAGNDIIDGGFNYSYTVFSLANDFDPADYSIDHVIPRKDAPHLTWEPSNWRPVLTSRPLSRRPRNVCRTRLRGRSTVLLCVTNQISSGRGTHHAFDRSQRNPSFL